MRKIDLVAATSVGLVAASPRESGKGRIMVTDDRRSVSIALATYNGARFLAAQLDTLAAQTLRPCELVVGDDGSSDETVAIVRGFAERAPFPVRLVVNQANLHFGENFIQTAARCTGRYVAFCDQDDLWLPEKLARCLEAMEAADAVLCGHDAWLVDAEGARIGRFEQMRRDGVHPPLTLPPWGGFFGFSMVIRRDVLAALPAEARGIDPITPKRLLAHDRWAYHLGTTLGRTVYIKRPLVYYRQHAGNAFGGLTEGLGARLGKLMLTSAPDLALHLDICRRRCAALAAASDGPFAAPAAGGAAYWGRLAEIYERRLAIAKAPSLARRCADLAALVRRGAYGANARGGLTARAFLKDAIATATPWRAETDAPAGRVLS